MQLDEDKNDPLPKRFRDIRYTERKEKDSVYSVLGDLSGIGLSLDESVKAAVIVSNGLFDRKWKTFDADAPTFDAQMMPNERNVRDKLQLMEAQALSLFADEIQQKSDEGRMITHAIDSTTKKGVGSFATQGIHIGKNVPLPLPLMNISGETTMDIALQVDFRWIS